MLINEKALSATPKSLLNGELSREHACAYLRELTPSKVSALDLSCFVQLLAGMIEPDCLPSLDTAEPVMDCCGTGGSGGAHFNVSTTAAFVLASLGIPVVKFGNRAAGGSCGSFDLLEALGISSTADHVLIQETLAQLNLAFLFAPHFYPCLKTLAPARKTVGVRTIFNIIGPLLNPAKPAFRLLGASDVHSQRLIANYLSSEPLNTCSLVVRSENGMDEIDPSSRTSVMKVAAGNISEFGLEPRARLNPESRQSLSVADNVSIFRSIISNEPGNAYFRQAVVSNAAAAIVVYGKANNMQEAEGITSEAISSYRVKDTFERFRRLYARKS